MPKFKLIISDPATGKSSATEVEGARAQALVGRSLGEVVDGGPIGVPGKLLISGGCDKDGIPMRPDVHGGVKKYIVLSSGVGFKPTTRGERRRKLVRGRTISDETYQINLRQTGNVRREEKLAAPLAQAPPKPPTETAAKPAAKGPKKRK